MVLKDWKRKTRGTDIFWNKEDKLVTVGKSLGTGQYFVFIDPGKKFKVRIEYAQNKQEAIRYAKSYMRKN